MKFNIPEEIINIIKKLQSANFEAYLVGGCVRDLLMNPPHKFMWGMNREPKDWDITTNAKPEEIQKLFPNNIYENKFGTVAVKTDSDDEQLKIIEITTFRLEGKYTDKRHPDEVKFAKTIEEDLSRRDFTINAIALKPNTQNLKPELVDPYNGQEDIKNKLIRSVGEPEKRFNEDALRLMRAIRFSVQLGWEIEKKTFAALKKEAGFIEMIAKERIRDEFIKIIMS
ncbi:hypothetical protein COY96_01375, partial [Candidatus Wolfebacteria bacterium CG_4_10_14_0_8_um_filter_37_11]